jgi:hypothetical protein
VKSKNFNTFIDTVLVTSNAALELRNPLEPGLSFVPQKVEGELGFKYK